MFECVLLAGVLVCFFIFLVSFFLEGGYHFIVWIFIIVCYLYVFGEPWLNMVRRSFRAQLVITHDSASLLLRDKPFKMVDVNPSLEIDIIVNKKGSMDPSEDIDGIVFYQDNVNNIVVHSKWGWTQEDPMAVWGVARELMISNEVRTGDVAKGYIP